VRSPRWHLVCDSRDGSKQWQLYDVKADPSEKTNVADTYPEVVKELDAAYDKWWDSVQLGMVNETVVGPKVNPFKVLYEKQFGETTRRSASNRPVKVFILAGQSNMEGKAPNTLFEHQATDPKTKDLFSHLRKDDKWIVRDDVFIKFLDRKGPLTLGYGSPGRTGIELEFGTMIGNHFEEPVLLIKTAWGGHSLYKLFRSPSAGYPADEVLQKELKQAQANVKKNNDKNKKNDPLPTLEDVKKEYGSSYRNMLAEVKDVMDHSGTMFPALKDKSLELAGFVWFQGWNDQYGAQDEYESNLKHLIHDVRKDLKSPKLPFVIGVMGQNGSKAATGAMLTIQKAQLAMNDVPEFKGNVKAIRTDVLVDKAAEKLYPSWQKNLEEWKQTGGDHGYHYLGSAIWFNRIGKAMGEAMLELMRDQK
jgi:alpha-galactosidase